MATRRNLDYDDPFVARLRNLRKEHNYSFKELQSLTGISSSSLQRYEKGIGANLPLNKLYLIAQAYNVSISYLMGYDSKDLPRDQYEVIIPLLDHEGFKITYHNETETFTLDSENNSIPIEIEQIKELSTAVQSYFRFKFFEIIKPPTTK